MFKKFWALISLVLTLWQGVAGQGKSPIPYFRNFTTEHGLPSSEVYDLHQDNDGFIRFSTDNGISRFDGRTFKNFSAEAGLTDNVVFRVITDNEGRLWANTMSGKLFQIVKDSLVAFRYNHIISSYKSGNDHETGMFFANDGTLYIGLADKGILTIDTTGASILTAPKHALEVVKKDNGMVFSTKYHLPEKKILFTDNNTSKVFDIDFPGEISSGFVHLTQSGELLVYSDKVLLLIKDGKIVRSKEIGERFTQIREDNGKLLVGQVRGGLTIADNINDYFDGKGTVLFPNYTVSDYLVDHEGGHWFSTIERGVFYCPDINLVHYGSDFGLTSLSYLSVAIKNETEFYVLSADGIVYMIDTESNNLNQLPPLPPFTNQADILYCRETERLFCLGTNLCEFTDGHWRILSDSRTGPLRGNKKMRKVRGEKLLYISGKTGFSIYNYGAEKVVFSGNDRVTNDWIRAMYKTSSGQILVGGSGGLFVLENGKLNPPKLRDELLKLRVNDINELPDGRTVISTLGGGLLILDGMKLTALTTENGLATNMLGAVEVDEFGRIWAAGKRGLHLIRQTESGWTVRVFDKQDGLPDTEVTDIEVTNDRIAFCTPAGAGYLPKDIFVEATSPEPRIIFEKITIDGKNIEPGTYISLASGANDVAISYSSICFKYPHHMKFGYKILGLGDDWMFTSGPKLFVSDLEHGNYEIVLQTTSSAGAVSNQLSLQLEVKKPIWSTWWFIVITLFLAGVTLYIIFMAILRIARKNDRNEKKLIQLERSALQAQMNPHFIFNALNSIQSYIAGNENDKATRFLAKFSRLIRMMLNHSMSGKITLKDEIESLTIYLELEQMRFKNKFEFQITVDDEINPESIQIPPLLIQPYLENAIIHGLSQTRSQGRINLYYLLQDDYIMVTVTDNGIGIEASMNQKTKHASLHKSVGMTITQKRLELLDEANADKKVNIEEIKDRNGQVLGTKVEVMIKIMPEDRAPVQPKND